MSDQPNPGEVTREPEPPTQELVVQEPVGHGALAAQTLGAEAEAVVKAKFAIAQARPRDEDLARQRMLRACKRPKFAAIDPKTNQSPAMYSRPVGGGKRATGLTIRAAEMALQCWGNVDVHARTIFEDELHRKVRIDVTDLETNTSYASEVMLEKVVERRQLKDGQRHHGARMNSTGQMVYMVDATEDDMLQKTNSAVSRAIRNAAFRIIPIDIREEMIEEILATQRNRDAEDPDAARKAILDAFVQLGVSAPMVKDYLGKEVSLIQPAEVEELRGLYAGVREGHTTWEEIMANKREREREEAEGEKTPETGAGRAKAAAKKGAAKSGEQPES